MLLQKYVAMKLIYLCFVEQQAIEHFTQRVKGLYVHQHPL